MASQAFDSRVNQNKIRQVDLRSIVLDIFKSLWIIAIAVITVAAIAFVSVTELYTPTYESTITYVVTSNSTSKTVYNNITKANDLATAFSNVLNSAVMKTKVSETLGENFSGKIVAKTINETNLLNVTVSAKSPQAAFKAARAVIANHHIVTDEIMQNAVLQILEDPEVPSSPANGMNRSEIVKRSSVIAAFAMLLLVIWFSYSRDTVKNVGEFSVNIDAQLFSTVYHEKTHKTLKSFLTRKKTGLLISFPSTSFGFVETAKKIGTRVEYLAVKKNIKTIMITSVLENEGKSTIAANLAIALAEKGKRVLLIDADLRRHAIYKLFECADGNNDIEDVLTGRVQMTDAVHLHGASGVYLLSGHRSSTLEIELASSNRMKEIIEAARPVMDYVIIDTAPMSVASDAESISGYCDGSILVVRQDSAKVKDINDTVDVLKDSGREFIGCIFNDASTQASKMSYGYGYNKYYNKYSKNYENSRLLHDYGEKIDE